MDQKTPQPTPQPPRPKQIIDVAAPMRTEQQPLTVHQAPVDVAASMPSPAPSSTEDISNVTAPASSISEVQVKATSVTSTKEQLSSKPVGPKRPVAAIVMTLFMMAGLSALSILVYLKSL